MFGRKRNKSKYEVETLRSTSLDEVRIGVLDYDWAERVATREISNEAIRAFRPVAFERVGYPIRVTEEQELIRYVDVFHELDDPKLYLEENQYSADEAEIIADIGDRVADYTKKAFGQPTRPWMGPVCALNMARVVSELGRLAGKKQLTVLEIGPGSGYLSALLLKMGHRYLGTDATQSLYLWQNRLLSLLTDKDDFLETAGLREFPASASHVATHLPWWQLSEMFRNNTVKADVIICDHAVGELHRFALTYVLRLAKDMMADSPVGLFLYDGHGEPHVNSPDDVRLVAESLGMHRVSEKQFTAYGLAGKDMTTFQSLDSEVPIYRPSGRSETMAGVEFLRLAAEEAPRSYEFFDYLGHTTARPRS